MTPIASRWSLAGAVPGDYAIVEAQPAIGLDVTLVYGSLAVGRSQMRLDKRRQQLKYRDRRGGHDGRGQVATGSPRSVRASSAREAISSLVNTLRR